MVLAGMVGKACNLLHNLSHGMDVDHMDLVKQIGDVVIFGDLLCDAWGTSLEECAENKLAYYEGRTSQCQKRI